MSFISSKGQPIKTIDSAISLHKINEIEVLIIEHKAGKAAIALQGAQLLSWQPHFCQKDVLWLSEIEPFKQGQAIRGGIPICYPWFGRNGDPIHGYARISLWQLDQWQVSESEVKLSLVLKNQHQQVEAEIAMTFSDDCQIDFTHYGEQPAQLALHSYFNISQIEGINVTGLPATAYDHLQQKNITIPPTLTINSPIDAVFTGNDANIQINDEDRSIQIINHNTSDTVVWNPWHQPTSAMSDQAYKNMLCVESARINSQLQKNESVRVMLKVIG